MSKRKRSAILAGFLVTVGIFLLGCGPDAYCIGAASGPGWSADAVSSHGGRQVELRWRKTDAQLRLLRYRLEPDMVIPEKRFGIVRGTRFVDTEVEPDTMYQYSLTSMKDPEDGTTLPCATTVWIQSIFTASQVSWSASAFGEVYPLWVNDRLWLFDRGESVRLLSPSDGALHWWQTWLPSNWLTGDVGMPVFLADKNAIASYEFTGEDKVSLFLFDFASGTTIAEVPRRLKPAASPLAFDDGSGKTAITLVEYEDEASPSQVSLLSTDGAVLWSTRLFLSLYPMAFFREPALETPTPLLSWTQGERLLVAGRDDTSVRGSWSVAALNASGKSEWQATGYHGSFLQAGDELYAVNETSAVVLNTLTGAEIRSAPDYMAGVRWGGVSSAYLSREPGGPQSLVVTHYGTSFTTVVLDASSLDKRWSGSIGRVVGLGPVNGDDVEDVFSLSQDDNVLTAYDGLTGAHLWRYVVNTPDSYMNAKEVKLLTRGEERPPIFGIVRWPLQTEGVILTILDAQGAEAATVKAKLPGTGHSWRNFHPTRITALPPDHVLFQVEQTIYAVAVP